MGTRTTAEEVMNGRQPAARPEQVAGGQMVQGIILGVTGAGVTFSLPSFPNRKWGPAPWNMAQVQATTGLGGHTHPPTPPPVGAQCVILFVQTLNGVSPWVLAWWVPT